MVLIEHADQANEQTQNALLKALEEPTERHTFILVADEPARLLPTIRSRCQALRIGPVAHDELVRHLMDHRRLPADQAETLASLANGLSGLAVRYADRPDVLDWRRRVQAELLALLERGRADRFGAVGDLLDEAARLERPPAGGRRGRGGREGRALRAARGGDARHRGLARARAGPAARGGRSARPRAER